VGISEHNTLEQTQESFGTLTHWKYPSSRGVH
jgi:hypothetical protein